MSWCCVLRLHPGCFFSALWVDGKPVFHVSEHTIRPLLRFIEVVCSNQNTSGTSVVNSLLRLSAEHYISLLSVTPSFVCFSPRIPSPLLRSLSFCLLSVSLPSRHPGVSKLMGSWRTPLLLSDSSKSSLAKNKKTYMRTTTQNREGRTRINKWMMKE